MREVFTSVLNLIRADATSTEAIKLRRLKRMNERQSPDDYRVLDELQLKQNDFVGDYAPVMLVGYDTGDYWSVEAFALRERTQLGPYAEKNRGKIRIDQREMEKADEAALNWINDSTNGYDLVGIPKIPEKLVGLTFKKVVYVRKLSFTKGV